MPEPDPMILQQALKRQEEEASLNQLTRGSGRRGRRSNVYLMSEVNSLVNRMQYFSDPLDDYVDDWGDGGDSSGYDDYDDDDRFRRRNDCVIS